MRQKIIVAFLAFLIILGLAGCGQPKSAGPAQGAAAAKGGAQEAWQKEWEALKQAAKKEGSVVVTTDLPVDAMTAMRNAWEKAGFGVSLMLESIPGAEFGKKVAAERSAGVYSVDAVMHGQNTMSNVIKAGGYLDPIDDKILILPEVKDPKYWFQNRLHYADKEMMVLGTLTQVGADVWVNTNLMDPKTIKTYQDLLKPEYKGKIVLGEPRLAGASQQWLGAMIETKTLDEAYLNKLKEQIDTITPDRNQLAQWLAQGKYPIAMGVRSDVLGQMKKQGAPIAGVLMDKGAYYGTGAAALGFVNKAPHPNAAKLFINWELTRETQTAITPSMGYVSARVDVPTTGLVPEVLRLDGVKYLDVGTEELQKKLPGVRVLLERVFGAPGLEQKKNK